MKNTKAIFILCFAFTLFFGSNANAQLGTCFSTGLSISKKPYPLNIEG